MNKLIPFLLLSSLGEIFKRDNVQKIAIDSYPVKQPKQSMQLSKQQTQKLKGKKARKNRGRKRT